MSQSPSNSTSSKANLWPRIRWGVFLLALAAIFLRGPDLLLEPRLWAEEGSNYLRRLYSKSFLEGVTYVTSAGYINGITSLSIAFACKVVPLSGVPWITTLVALLVQLSPIVVILWGRSLLFRRPWSKVLATSMVIFAPTNDTEAWLNTLNAMSWFGILGFVLLMEDLSQASKKRRTLYAIALTAGCLSGPYCLFLLPAFALKAWVGKSRSDALILVPAVGAALLQVVVASTHATDNQKRWEDRIQTVNLWIRPLAHHVVEPIGGLERADRLAKRLPRIDPLDISRYWVPLVVLTIALVSLRRRKEAPSHLALVSFLSVSVLTTVFAFGHDPSSRYAVVPGLLFLFLILSNIESETGAARPWGALRSTLGLVLIGWSLQTGIQAYRDGPNLVYKESSPRWSEEVERWQRDPRSPIRIWPEGWEIRGLEKSSGS